MTTAFDKDLELIFQKLTSDRQVKQALDFNRMRPILSHSKKNW